MIEVLLPGEMSPRMAASYLMYLDEVESWAVFVRLIAQLDASESFLV